MAIYSVLSESVVVVAAAAAVVVQICLHLLRNPRLASVETVPSIAKRHTG